MELFIRGAGSISPQATHREGPLLQELQEYESPLLNAIEPPYKEWIPGKELRRMSRLVKMGIGAARLSLEEANSERPDAIVTGTGLGGMKETENFLLSMIDENEEGLNPSPFIRSTHNSLGGQLAISLGCKGYNHTYVHRGLSFPSALLDSELLLNEDPDKEVMVGGFDEITDEHFRITQRIGRWKNGPVKNLDLLKNDEPGSLAGEGAQFFLLSGRETEDRLAKLQGVDFFYSREQGENEEWIRSFLNGKGLDLNDIDAVIYGYSGDPASDKSFDRVREELFPEKLSLYYKQLSGQYHTASSFALWLASRILHEERVPSALHLQGGRGTEKVPERILVYDHWFDTDHSLFLLSK